MKTLLVNNHTKHLKELISLFSNTTIIEKENLKNGVDLSLYDLLVFSGGSDVPTVLRHPEEYSLEMNLIREANISILGICLGAEIIIKAFGGELRELSEEYRGNVKLRITDEKLKLLNGSDVLEVKEGHHVGIKNVPNDFTICAYSEHSPEIIRHTRKPILAIQFHPEISKNENLIKWLLGELNFNFSGTLS